MDRARSRKLWTANVAPSTLGGRLDAVRLSFSVGALLLLLSTMLLARNADAGEIALLPSADGHLGAWLALGPIPATTKGNPTPRTLETNLISGLEESSLTGRLGRQVSFVPFDTDTASSTSSSWRVVSAANGSIDIAAALGQHGPEAFGFLFGVLHLSGPVKGVLLLGSSDGARVWIDRKVVSSSDYFRLEHDDEDVVRLDLPAGDHPILIKLHHRDNYWAARVRLVDTSFAPPHGVWLRLPGTSDEDARSLAAKMVNVEIDRGLTPTGFRPTVTVSFAEGLPRGTDRLVRISASTRRAGTTTRLFALNGGEVPLGVSGPSELRVKLPGVTKNDLGEAENDGELVMAVDVAGRRVEATSPLRSFMRPALAAAEKALSSLDEGDTTFVSDAAVTRATLEHLRDRFVHYVDAGDTDTEALAADARTIVAYGADLEAKRDPLRSHAGILRFAYRSPLDGELSPFGVYVPASYAEGAASGKTYPLVVVLHGMNGKPISMVRWFFGHDDEAHDSEWEDRHPGDADPIEGFVIAPNAFGNAMYRELGEVDVMSVLDWAEKFFPIDKNRITISGVSMGGTGAASIALRYPHRFAAAEPLCGYHSYFIRKDLMGRGMWSWEKLLSENRSNALWAENGQYLPLYIWHGKRDLPEKNSGVLIDRYKSLGYSIEDEHPDVGHDVWKRAYDGAAGFRWLSQKTRVPAKRSITFKTDSPRYVDDAWVHLREISSNLEFATVNAEIVSPGQIDVTTHGVEAILLDRDPELISGATSTLVKIDGTSLTFAPSVPLAAYRTGQGWKAGVQESATGLPAPKRAGLSGPMRDVFFEPLVFVYGTGDPSQTRANRDTARAWAKIRWGVDARYPIIADVDFDERLADTHSLVLVGNSQSNSLVRDLEPRLPFKVTPDGIFARSDPDSPAKEWKGHDLGVAFVYPNPKHPARYVLVLEGTSPLGTLRSVALPELLPDFMVFDDKIASARGQILLGNAAPIAAGLFRADWSLGRTDPIR